MPLNAKPQIFRRGGNRKRADVVSYKLTDDQVARLIDAMRAAIIIGLPLNRFVTIHWKGAGVAERHAAKATGQFLKYARDWLGLRHLPTAYVWTRENDLGDGSKGDHVHILLHVPKGQSLGSLQRRWLRAITGKRYTKGVIKTERVGGTVNAAIESPQHYEANLRTVGSYILKGGSQDVSDVFDLGRWGEGGRVVGQRVGMSKNLLRVVQTGVIA